MQTTRREVLAGTTVALALSTTSSAAAVPTAESLLELERVFNARYRNYETAVQSLDAALADEKGAIDEFVTNLGLPNEDSRAASAVAELRRKSGRTLHASAWDGFNVAFDQLLAVVNDIMAQPASGSEGVVVKARVVRRCLGAPREFMCIDSWAVDWVESLCCDVEHVARRRFADSAGQA